MTLRFARWPALAALAVSATSIVCAQAPNIAGRVITPGGSAIPGADVRIGGTTAATRSDDHGAFRFVGAPKGVQTLMVRRIGYLPTSLSVRVPENSDTVTVMMVPSNPALDTVKVVASVNVLAGVIIDSANRVIPGARIDMIGMRSATTQTDSNGWFTFTSVKSGTVVLRIRKLGYEPTTYSTQLDDWRGIVVRLSPLQGGLSDSQRERKSGFGNSAEFVWTETHDRLVRRGAFAVIVPREQLAPYGDLTLGQAIRFTQSGALATADLQLPGNDVCVLIDGDRMVGSTTLDSFRADDVQFVELYPPGTEVSGTVARYLKGAGCHGLRTSATGRRGPYYAVVWLRA